MKVRLVPVEEVEAIGREAQRSGNEPVFQLANEVLGVRAKVRAGEITAESIEIAIWLGQSIIEAACAARIDALFVARSTQAGIPQDALTAVLRVIRASRVDETVPSSQKRDLERWARRATKGQQESDCFLSLWSEKMATDPLSAPDVVMQIGLAILLDKTIVIIAPYGATIPVNVQRAARSTKFYNPADLQSLEHATRAALHEAGLAAPS